MSICYCASGQPTNDGPLHRYDRDLCPRRRDTCRAEGHKVYLGSCAWCGASVETITARQEKVQP